MPSRKGYRKTSRRRGSRKGQKPIRRSLRFTPRFVIKERADTIEDTLNSTMRRGTHRIPKDIANMIQGYEGGATLYFAVDPLISDFVLSTNSFKGANSIDIIPSKEKFTSMDGPYIYIIKSGIETRTGEVKRIFYVLESPLDYNSLETQIYHDIRKNDNPSEIDVKILRRFKYPYHTEYDDQFAFNLLLEEVV